VVKPTFSLALLWDATSSPDSVKQLIESLDTRFPPSNVSNIGVTLSEVACLHFSIDFSLYVKKTLAQVTSEVEKSGGRFIELLRLPEDKREEFRAKYLVPTGAASSTFKQLRDCGPRIQDHVTKLSKGIHEAHLVQPAIRAATSQSSGRPRRQATRYGCNLEVEIQTDNGFVRERALNISIGGIFVRTSRRPALNSELGLKVCLPNGQQLQTKARVVHVKDEPAPGGVGLRFSQDDGVFMGLLQRYFSPREKK
jgi:uncharacterized protein (TIGR02266 family)